MFHVDMLYDAGDERVAILDATRASATTARLRSTTKCEGCKMFMIVRNTDPGSLAVPRFCAECNPSTANTEKNA